MNVNYPQCLKDELAKYDYRPTGNIEWDRAILNTLKHKNNADYCAMVQFDNVMRNVQKDIEAEEKAKLDLSNPSVYNTQFLLWKEIADKVLLSQRRKFQVDDDNCDVIRFLLHYFHECPLAEDVFPGRGSKLAKNILLQGKGGAGKNLIM